MSLGSGAVNKNNQIARVFLVSVLFRATLNPLFNFFNVFFLTFFKNNFF